MVRTVQVDEVVQQYADQRMRKRAELEVGVLLGRSATSGKDAVLQLIPSPVHSETDPPIRIVSGTSTSARKGSGPGKLELDEDWVVEHASQLSRTLAGGLEVLGLYVFCDDGAFQSSQSALSHVLRVIGEECDTTSQLVLHMSAITAKLTARELDGAALKPADVKPAALLSNMVEVRLNYILELDIGLADEKQRLHEAITSAIEWEAEQRVQPAVVLIDGRPMATEAPSSPSQVSEYTEGKRFLQCQVALPLANNTCAVVGLSGKAMAQGQGRGQYVRHALLSVSGVIDCRAYVHKREPIAAAMEAIKSDVRSTLLARLDVLVEAAEMATDAARAKYDASIERGAQPGQKPPKHPLTAAVGDLGMGGQHNLTLPRRAFVSWTKGGCCFCDYIVGGEGVSEALERLKELVGEDVVDGGTFACEESLSAGVRVLAGEEGHQGNNRKGSGVRSGALGACNATVVGGVCLALVGVYVSWIYAG